MRNRRSMMANRYLFRVDEIVNQMENKMLNPNITNSITIDFIQCMIPHHKAAIYMCQNLLQYTNYRPLIKITDDIIKMQEKGIVQMEEIEKTTMGYLNMQREVENYMSKYLEITKNMIEKMRNSPRCLSINVNFANEMIPHHEGAIAMCENLLQYRIDPRLVDVAKTIIREQSESVNELENVRKRLCNT